MDCNLDGHISFFVAPQSSSCFFDLSDLSRQHPLICRRGLVVRDIAFALHKTVTASIWRIRSGAKMLRRRPTSAPLCSTPISRQIAASSNSTLVSGSVSTFFSSLIYSLLPRAAAERPGKRLWWSGLGCSKKCPETQQTPHVSPVYSTMNLCRFT
jgi:hypothetical protein